MKLEIEEASKALTSMDTKLYILVVLNVFLLCSNLGISSRPLFDAAPSSLESQLDAKPLTSQLSTKPLLPPLLPEVTSPGKWLPMPNLLPPLPIQLPNPAIPVPTFPGIPFIIHPLPGHQIPGWGSLPNLSQPRVTFESAEVAEVGP